MMKCFDWHLLAVTNNIYDFSTNGKSISGCAIQYPIIKQIQRFKPHFQCLGLFPLWIIDKRTFNGWISDAKIGLFYKLTNMWEGSLVLLLLWCYFSTLLKHYGDHYMVQSISSWLASEAITAIRSIIGQSIWKKETNGPSYAT